MLGFNNHVALRASTVEEVDAFVRARIAAKVLRSASDAPFEAVVHSCELPVGQLCGCAYGIPITLGFSDGDYLRVQIGRRGAGETRIGGAAVPIGIESGCVSVAKMEVGFGAGFEQVVWRVPCASLVAALSALTGAPVVGALRFEAGIDLRTPAGRALVDIVACMTAVTDAMDGNAARLVLTELEHAAAAALIGASPHSHRHLVDREASGAAPWQVRRAEDFIAANWDKPLGMGDLVAATGVSARSLFRMFPRYRGCSPMGFLKRVRLENAHRLLGAGDRSTSVTDTALRCGFGDLSRFSKDFRAAFGETPSTLLRRRQRAVAG